MKNQTFIFIVAIFFCCSAAIQSTPMPTVKEDVRQLTQESQQLIGFMKQLINLHESGVPVRISAPIDSLNIDFGVTNPGAANKAILRLRFRQAAQIVKDKMDELLAIVPE